MSLQLSSLDAEIRRWRDRPALAYVLVVLATFFWAGNVTLGRAMRFSAGPFTIAAGRMCVASVVFLFLFRSLPRRERRPGREWRWLLAMSLLGMVGCPVTLYLALRFTTATSTSLISGTGPLITLMLAAALLHTRLTRNQLSGALLSLLGVVLVIGAGEGWKLSGFTPNVGALIMMVNVVMWGLYSVMARVITRNRSALWVTAYSTWFAVPILVTAAVLEWRQAPPTLDVALVLGLLYIGIFATCLGYMAWNEGVRRVGPDGAMAFYNMLPVFGVLLGALFLGERMTAGQWFGGALIIFGGLVAALWAHRPWAGVRSTG
jgi:drug/metabolite transporter (DMT)-like permease